MQSNKTVIIFLLKFFSTYALLFFLYNAYLNKTQNIDAVFSCAPITKVVAEQTKYLLNIFNYNAEIEQSSNEISMLILVNNKYVARVIEGCNSISVIILFISFIIAFASGFKSTFFYIVFGSLLIYSINIFRIAVISIALYKYPDYEDVLHNIIFPAIIYGTTFLLWVLWVTKFSKIKK